MVGPFDASEGAFRKSGDGELQLSQKSWLSNSGQAHWMLLHMTYFTPEAPSCIACRAVSHAVSAESSRACIPRDTGRKSGRTCRTA
jgi:hypothetical protein